jgi:hypothetical protein
MQGGMKRRPEAPLFGPKKWAVKLGEPHRPFDLPTEGGVFHRKVGLRERDFRPAPRKEPSAGATNAGDTLHGYDPTRRAL